MKDLQITSPVFDNKGFIPTKYTCDGEDVNPPLYIKGIPEATKSLVLIMDDPDAPLGTWDHWIIWDIPITEVIKENSVPGIEGINSYKKHEYGGPCPPFGTHRYFFKVYALDTMLNLDRNSRKKDVERAMEGHIIAKGELVGLYKR
jgi:Raf kinase inhibitor-like YbhB/YbcL family protein